MNQYSTIEYNDKRRWASFWHQIDEILNFEPKKILEIGKGSGVVSSYLESQGFEMLTFDIDPDVRPDIVGSVLDLPFPDNSFDVVLAAEILEHLPFDDFSKALAEIYRMSALGAVISLPHFGVPFRFLLKLPFIPEIKFIFKLPYPVKHEFKGEHFWEIGKLGFSLGRVKAKFRESGFKIAKTYLVFESPLHRFFILKK